VSPVTDDHAHLSYRSPRDCPVCSDRLHVTRLGCPSCGTGLTGEFQPCEFCGLDDAERALLRVFLASRGNMKEVERHLGVSYPTARARFDDLLATLGIPLSGSAPAAPSPSPSPSPSASPSPIDPRLATLQAVADGSLDVDAARQKLSGT
jgi:hypothetical protein